MKFAYFPGCKIPFYADSYGRASKAVLVALGVELSEIEFTCCGYPIHNLDFEAYVLSAARNMALAEKAGLDMLTPCMCCFGSLKHAAHTLHENEDLRNRINDLLGQEGLVWSGRTQVKHLLTVLAHDVGIEAIGEKIRKPFEGLKIAAHYGCHALRPSNVTRFDDPSNPTIFENLVAVTGATAVPWSKRLDCCGNPVWSRNEQLAVDLMRDKLNSARSAGAHYICTACTYCQIQFDRNQAEKIDRAEALPAILYPQLLGLSLGLKKKALGLEDNRLSLKDIYNFMP